MGSGGGASKQSTSVSTPYWLVPHNMEILRESQKLWGTGGPEPYPNSRVADLSPETTQALGLLKQRALDGSPITRSSQGLLDATLRGDYLNANPYLDATYNRAVGAVRSAVDSKYGLGWRSGSGAEANAFVSGAGQLADSIYGGNYQAERGRQMAALGLAPQLAGMDYADLDRLAMVGGAWDQRAQALKDDEVARWNEAQQRPYAALDWYADKVLGLNSSFRESTTTGTAPGKNRAAGAATGALGGAAMGTAIYPGIGTAVGAIAGGLIGGLG